MPTYDYFCPKCDKMFEIRHGINFDEELYCHEHPDTAMERQISGGGAAYVNLTDAQKARDRVLGDD